MRVNIFFVVSVQTSSCRGALIAQQGKSAALLQLASAKVVSRCSWCHAVLEDMEANELLALLANLGAQQQAVLAAIAGKHQGSQRAADRRQPEGMAFPSSLSTLPISRPLVNISAAAGEAAAAAQQQKPEQKPWRVPGGQFN